MALEPAEVKEYREKLKTKGPPRLCPHCHEPMTRHGCYVRTDVRLPTGQVLAPIPIQRWRCAIHGTTSVLPRFLAKYLRYLVEVIGMVCDAVLAAGRVVFPNEVCGPAPETARRWFHDLCSSADAEAWLLQRYQRYVPTAALDLTQHLPRRLIGLARTITVLFKFSPLLYPRLLQTARFAA